MTGDGAYMDHKELKGFVARVIGGHSDDDGVCEPESAADDILGIIRAEVQSRLKAMRAAMFAVNLDFGRQSVQAYDRPVGNEQPVSIFSELRRFKLTSGYSPARILISVACPIELPCRQCRSADTSEIARNVPSDIATNRPIPGHPIDVETTLHRPDA